MKYKVTLNNRVYEVEVEQGEAWCSSLCRGARSRTGSRRARRGRGHYQPHAR